MVSLGSTYCASASSMTPISFSCDSFHFNPGTEANSYSYTEEYNGTNPHYFWKCRVTSVHRPAGFSSVRNICISSFFCSPNIFCLSTCRVPCILLLFIASLNVRVWQSMVQSLYPQKIPLSTCVIDSSSLKCSSLHSQLNTAICIICAT